MASFTVALARWMTAASLANYDEHGANGDLFLGPLPKHPDQALALVSTGGLPDIASGTLPYDRPTAQLTIRSERGEWANGEQRGLALYDSLNGLHRVILNPGGPDEIYLVGMTAPVPPYYIQTDAQGRHLWTLNLQAMVKRPTLRRPTT